MSIPLIKEQLEQNLIIEALVQGVVAKGFLFGDLHLGLSAQQLLLSDLFLLNGCPVFLRDFQTGQVETAHFDVVKFVELISNSALNQSRNVVPFRGDGHQFVLREHRLQSLQQRRLNDAGINLPVSAGNGAVNTTGFIRAQGVFDCRRGLDHLQILGQGGEFLGPNLSPDAEGPSLLHQWQFDVQTGLPGQSTHLAQGCNHSHLSSGHDEQRLS